MPRHATSSPTARRLQALAFAAACGLALAGASASAQSVTPPPVPAEIAAPAGARAFLLGHAVGTQNYVCLPSGKKAAWSLFTPQATLFDDAADSLATHFASPNPVEGGTVRPTWQHSRDTSSVWAKLASASSDPAFVAPGALPWFLLQIVGTLAGPTGGDAFTSTTYIQRVNTAGGLAPATGCSVSSDVGKKQFVPYTADYVFYR